MKTKKKISLSITEEFVDQRLDRFLTTIPDIFSRSYAQDLIEKNLVHVDQKKARASLVLKLNQIVEILLPEKLSSILLPFDLPLNIVFEDDDVIVVNKPSGLVVHPAAGHQQDTLVNALLSHTKMLSMKNEQRPGIVHRLDKETSGLLVVAKNDQTHENLALQFKNKSTHRIYYALAEGVFKKSSGHVQSYLARHPTDRKKYASIKQNNKIKASFEPEFESGKWAVTHYEKIAQAAQMTYLKLRLETGRTHQIRVHMSELGHRLVGDTTYGYSLQKMKSLNLNRFYLHAAELGFIHPTSKKSCCFKVAWPLVDSEKMISLGFDHDLFE